MLDLAIIIPELLKYGGAERIVLECIRRWQNKCKITLYSSAINKKLLQEHGISQQIRHILISPDFKTEHSMVLNSILLPQLWHQEIGMHQLYLAHLWPTHLIDLHPMVWYPHEPPRVLHDLRYNASLDNLTDANQRKLHVYPKYNYDLISCDMQEAYFSAIAQFDQLAKPDCIVANSKYIAEYIKSVYHIPVTDIVYPGVNTEDFFELYDESPHNRHAPSGHLVSRFDTFADLDENVILTVGQLWNHKQIDKIIEAIPLVPNCQLYIVGDGPEKNYLKRIAEELAVADRVFFLQNITNQELKILYARCRASVFMALREPFGIVTLESLAAGKPLIANNEGGYTEIVDESCAILIPASPPLIAEKIRYLLENKQKALEMGFAARQRSRRFTWDRHAKQMYKILEDVSNHWQKNHPVKVLTEKKEHTLFGAQYYCWYGKGIGAAHWNDNAVSGGVTDMPWSGYYSSSEGETIRRHLKIMEDIGFDFAILNLHVDSAGSNAYEMATIENMFHINKQAGSPIKLCVQICPYECSAADIKTTIELLRKKLTGKDNYLQLNGRPVLFVFWTGVHDSHKKWINALAEVTENLCLVASSLRMYHARTEPQNTFGLFDGWSLYSPLELTDVSHQQLWLKAYANSNAGRMGLRIVTISPGYDDSHLKDANRLSNPHRVVDRHDGHTYQEMIDFTLSIKPAPHMVLVSTFNEYHENTHIEASLKNNHKYEQMTKTLIHKGRSIWQ